jgi:hypothetical protein
LIRSAGRSSGQMERTSLPKRFTHSRSSTPSRRNTLHSRLLSPGMASTFCRSRAWEAAHPRNYRDGQPVGAMPGATARPMVSGFGKGRANGECEGRVGMKGPLHEVAAPPTRRIGAGNIDESAVRAQFRSSRGVQRLADVNGSSESPKTARTGTPGRARKHRDPPRRVCPCGRPARSAAGHHSPGDLPAAGHQLAPAAVSPPLPPDHGPLRDGLRQAPRQAPPQAPEHRGGAIAGLRRPHRRGFAITD